MLAGVHDVLGSILSTSQVRLDAHPYNPSTWKVGEQGSSVIILGHGYTYTVSSQDQTLTKITITTIIPYLCFIVFKETVNFNIKLPPPTEARKPYRDWGEQP